MEMSVAVAAIAAQEGSIGGEQGRFAYLDTEHDRGTVTEISDISGPKGQFFSYIRQAAADWVCNFLNTFDVTTDGEAETP